MKYQDFKDCVKIHKELNEMAISGEFDWVDNKAFGFISSRGLATEYKKVDDLKIDNEVYQLFVLDQGSTKVFNLGKMRLRDDDKKLAVVASIQLRRVPDFMGLHNIWNVDDVRVVKTLQYRGIAKSLYLYLVKKLNMIILGDEVQYFGARVLWARLSKSNEVIVDIIDIVDKVYISKNVEIHHGIEEADFDKRVWSRDEELAHIRLILKDIK